MIRRVLRVIAGWVGALAIHAGLILLGHSAVPDRGEAPPALWISFHVPPPLPEFKPTPAYEPGFRIACMGDLRQGNRQ